MYKTIVFILGMFVVLMILAASFIPQHSTCLMYQQPYRDLCINMDDSNKEETIKLFWNR